MNGLEHFIRLARTGKNNRGASGGEKRAFRLAECVLNNVPGLDGEAIEGLIEFIKIVQPYPQEAHDLIEKPSPLGRRVPAALPEPEDEEQRRDAAASLQGGYRD